MARVTVEDCIEKITNRFELIISASQRAREISNGVPIEVEKNNDKNPVISLREIADGAVVQTDLEERFIRSLQKVNINNNIEDEEASVEEEFAAYIKESSSSEEESDANVTPNLVTSKAEEESFEDISEEAVRNEE